MMNIVFITQYQDVYGANKSLVNLLVGLQGKGYNTLVICPSKGEMTDYLNENNIKNISHYKFWGWEYKNLEDIMKMPYRFFRSGLALMMLLKIIKSFQVDVIYSNSSVIWIGKALSTLLKKPHVWHVREFGQKDYGIKMLGGNTLTSVLMNRSSAVISISKAIDREVLSRIKKHLKFQIYNGVINLGEISEVPKTVNRQKPFTFCMAGRLVASKGFREAILAFNQAVQAYPDSKFYIAGKGNDKDNFEKELYALVKKLNLEGRVKFLGYVKDMKNLYMHADCLLMCSKSEGLGRVTIEAMAYGLPVIGHNSGATPEIVRHGHNGYLYNDSKKELVDRMVKMIENVDYEIFSKNALLSVKKDFSIEMYVEKVEGVLNEIIYK